MNEHNSAVIRVNRVFDSCSDKDCFSRLPVKLCCGPIPKDINILRSRCASVENVCVSVEPVPFNKGFYQVDVTYNFNVELLGYECSGSPPKSFEGSCCAAKSIILYGSESTAKTFVSSDGCTFSKCGADIPEASVSVLEPIVLEAGANCGEPFVTIGIFTVTELSRPMTVRVPVMEYRIPGKPGCNDPESPCEIFGRLKFPEDEFQPPALDSLTDTDEPPMPADS